MPITVTQLAGKHHYFVVKPDDTVEILKQLITKRTEIVGETQALRVAGAPRCAATTSRSPAPASCRAQSCTWWWTRAPEATLDE